MNERRLWFWSPEKEEVYFLREGSMGETKLFRYDPDFAFEVYEVQHAKPFSLPSFRDLSTQEIESFQKSWNLTKISGLMEVPLLYYEGPRSDVDGDECGPKVWTLSQYSDPWKKALKKKEIKLVCDVQAGTRLMSRGARRLFTDIHGELSVDMDSYEFLGKWHEAAKVHSGRISEKMNREVWQRQSKEAALKDYLSSARIGVPIDRLRLASVFLGKELLESFLRDEGYFKSEGGLDFMASLLDQLARDIADMNKACPQE